MTTTTTTTAPIDPKRLARLSTLTLKEGAHDAFSKGVCAMEAVSWLAKEPTFSDHPACACPVIAAFMRRWNDNFSDEAERTRVLMPLIPVIVGTRSTPAIEQRRAWMATDWDIRARTPMMLRLVPSLAHHADAIEALPEIRAQADLYEARTVVQAASKDAAAARAAAWAAAWDAARAAAWDAARAAARAAAGAAAWDAAGAAARDAARDAAWAAAWDAATAAAGDAAGDAAWAAAWDAARARLRPTVDAVQTSATDLVRRMCALGEGLDQ